MPSTDQKVPTKILNLETHVTTQNKDYIINNEHDLIAQYITDLKESVKDITANDLKDVRPTDLYQHTIQLTNAKPFHEKMRPIPLNKRKEFDEMIDAMLSNGMLIPCESPYTSATRLVKKSDGSMRITIDYRMLNSMTVPDRYPLPIIEDILNALAKAVYFSSLDLCSGYFQISLEKESQ